MPLFLRRPPKGIAPNANFERHGYIFIHIPKCAGASFALNMLGYFPGHTTVRQYEQFLGSEELRKRFTFAFARDPVARFKSAYAFLKNGGINAHDALLGEALPPPNKLIADLLDGRRFSKHFEPQVSFLKNHSEQIGLSYLHRLEESPDGLLELARDSVGASFADRLGRALSPNSRKNASPGLNVDIDKRKLYRLYDEDYWRLGYTA